MTARPVAIITGALRGIGRACAVALAEAGFNILLNDVSDDSPREVEAHITALGAESAFFACDIADLDRHPDLIHAALSRWSSIDCLVNNAGVSALKRGDLLDVAPESFDRCIRVNTRAVFFLSQAVTRLMLATPNTGGHHRSIINITSSNAVAVSVERGEYCVSKCAASMTTRLFALRLAAEDIGVYEVRPGIIETDMTLPVKAHYDALIENTLPAHRWGLPRDVANTVRSLAEGRLTYTVGQAITVDGGLTIPRF